jgi:tetratricopeptide (TPR) repeat protein
LIACRSRAGFSSRFFFAQVSLVKVGISLLLLQRFEDALWSFREALSVRKHALGALHPSTARIYNNIGCVYVEFNEFREARRAFEAALDTQRNALCHDPDSGPLMFGTATTLCNLGYLYRYRDMHDKAASVLKEALDLQECVLGRSHPTVLSTLDNLADSCVNSGHAVDALKYYNMLLDRFRVGGRGDNEKLLRAEAVLLYKMSRVHRQRNDREAQLDSLKLALRALRSEKGKNKSQDTLERRIQYDIRECRELLEKEQLKWV